MTTRKTYWPDNPWLWGFYAALILASLGCLATRVISLLAFILAALFIAFVAFYNSYLWRLEIDDHRLGGPSPFGPMVRVNIPWASAVVEESRFFHNRFFVISQKGSPHKIRISQRHFSRRSREEIRGLLSRHQGCRP